MRNGLLLGIFTYALLSAVAIATPTEAPKNLPPPNCFITVDTVRKSGAKNTRVFRIHQPSKTDCDQAAKLHETNYAPHAVAKKTVTHKWAGSE